MSSWSVVALSETIFSYAVFHPLLLVPKRAFLYCNSIFVKEISHFISVPNRLTAARICIPYRKPSGVHKKRR